MISIGTVVAFTTLQTRLLFPMQSLLSVGLEVQTSLALFGRIFEYLDLPVDIVERPGATPLGAAGRGGVACEVRLEDVWFRYRPDGPWTLQEIEAEFPPGRAPRWSARPARARPRSPTSSRACTSPSAGGSRSTAPTSAT